MKKYTWIWWQIFNGEHRVHARVHLGEQICISEEGLKALLRYYAVTQCKKETVKTALIWKSKIWF